jgi:hypothetical protein
VLRREFRVDYWGVDIKRAPGRLKIDSTHILSQDGWDFGVIDIDTYGSPWSHYFALLPHVRKHVIPASTVYTDEMGAYKHLREHGYRHEVINHMEKVYRWLLVALVAAHVTTLTLCAGCKPG